MANFSPFCLTLKASTNSFQFAWASALTFASSGSSFLPATKPSGAFAAGGCAGEHAESDSVAKESIVSNEVVSGLLEIFDLTRPFRKLADIVSLKAWNLKIVAG